MNRPVAKQFLPLGGRPVIVHTLDRFREAFPDLFVVLVLHDSLARRMGQDVVKAHPDAAVDQVVDGGAERFHSVLNGLDALPEGDGWVGIHDAVRPFVEVETIQRCYAGGRNRWGHSRGAGQGHHPPAGRRGQRTVGPRDLEAVQTPQVFAVAELRQAYGVQYQPHFTDDASVWEASDAGR